VAFLLPDDWFAFLNAVRTPGFTGIFGEGLYEKFSSMGNGSTFGLETLIFASLCHAVGAKKYLVYGDDIVVDKSVVDGLLPLLDDAGFLVNDRKSFFSGPFRESCGGNYHAGEDITPFRWRGTPSSKAGWCHIVNGLVPVAFPDGDLSQLLAKIVRYMRLPVGPWDSTSTCWVHVDASTAYDLGVIKSDRYTFGCRVKGYVARHQRESLASVYQLRKYFLWHLQALTKPEPSINKPVDGAIPASRAPLEPAPIGYRRKWRSWYPPAAETPVHLCWWSDLMVRER
jgi:hypothetical protein